MFSDKHVFLIRDESDLTRISNATNVIPALNTVIFVPYDVNYRTLTSRMWAMVTEVEWLRCEHDVRWVTTNHMKTKQWSMMNEWSKMHWEYLSTMVRSVQLKDGKWRNVEPVQLCPSISKSALTHFVASIFHLFLFHPLTRCSVLETRHRQTSRHHE